MEMESCAAPPTGFTISRAGEIDRLKSAAEVTVKPSGAEWDSTPLVPFTDTWKLPAATCAGIVSVTAWLFPAATTKGEGGEVVLPEGSPLNDTLTEPVNPFWPLIETLNCEVAPPAC